MDRLRRSLLAGVTLTVLGLCGSAVAPAQQDRPIGTIAFEGPGGLYLVDAAGGPARKIPGTRPGDGDPAWSPDGLQIAFDRGGGDRDIWVMDPDGRNQRRLTSAPADDGWPRWAPHGRAVTFHSDRDRDFAAYVVNVQSRQARRVASDAQYPDWRSDGRIVFQNADDFAIETVRPYGGGRRIEARDTTEGRWAVRVSDDGARIVFTDGARVARRLYTARADGSDLRLVIAGGQEIVNPAWSPDGAWITFSMGPEKAYDVYVVRADGTGLVRLTRTARGTFSCCSDWGSATTS